MLINMLKRISHITLAFISTMGVLTSIYIVYSKLDFSVHSYDMHGCVHGNYLAEKDLIKSALGKNLFFINTRALTENIRKNQWVKSVHIQRKVPNRLLIFIEEHTPVAIWKRGEKIVLIDAHHHVIESHNLKKFAYLPIISGDLADFEDVWSKLERYPYIIQKILYMERVGERRWNVCIAPNITIKLPEKEIDAALSTIYTDRYSAIRDDIRIIDCRVPGKVIVRKK